MSQRDVPIAALRHANGIEARQGCCAFAARPLLTPGPMRPHVPRRAGPLSEQVFHDNAGEPPGDVADTIETVETSYDVEIAKDRMDLCRELLPGPEADAGNAVAVVNEVVICFKQSVATKAAEGRPWTSVDVSCIDC